MDHFILVKMEKGNVMSEILEQAVAALTNKMGEASFAGSAKFDNDVFVLGYLLPTGADANLPAANRLDSAPLALHGTGSNIEL